MEGDHLALSPAKFTLQRDYIAFHGHIIYGMYRKSHPYYWSTGTSKSKVAGESYLSGNAAELKGHIWLTSLRFTLL